MMALPDPVWLKGLFTILVGIFDWVGRRKNVEKTAGMVYHLCQAEGTHSEAAYERCMTGEGTSYRQRKRTQIYFWECGEDMDLGLMAFHLHTQNWNATGGRRHWGTTAPNRDPHTYKMTFLTAGDLRNWPVKECWGEAYMRTAMQVHFYHQHVRDNMIILGEGNSPHPRCPQCNMLVTWQALNRRHIATAQCTKGPNRKLRNMAEEDIR